MIQQQDVSRNVQMYGNQMDIFGGKGLTHVGIINYNDNDSVKKPDDNAPDDEKVDDNAPISSRLRSHANADGEATKSNSSHSIHCTLNQNKPWQPKHEEILMHSMSEGQKKGSSIDSIAAYLSQILYRSPRAIITKYKSILKQFKQCEEKRAGTQIRII